MERPRDPKDWESWIDQVIRAAQERGDFADLPGRGKPLDLTANPYAHDQELAFKILGDAGFAPEWIELDLAIRRRLEKARAALLRAYERRTGQGSAPAGSPAPGPMREAGWRSAVAAFEEEVAAVNGQIADLNLKVPGARFQRRRVDAAREIAALEAGCK